MTATTLLIARPSSDSTKVVMAFSNKVVIVTGASSGIGEETAKQFSRQQALLLLTGRNKSALDRVAAECKRLGSSQVIALYGDLTNTDFVEELVKLAIEHFQRIDVLVNNAGILENGSIETSSLETYDRVMNINVRAVYDLTNRLVPHLIASKGSIVNVSSVVGLRAFPNILAYCMSKAALDQFTRCIALELAPKGVRVNAVNPGIVVSNLHTRSGMDQATYEEFLNRAKETQPLGRPGSVAEIAQSILFLAGDQSSFITAATLPIDGGKQASCPR